MQPQPVRFTPAVEQPAPDEATTIAQIDEAIRHIQETTLADSGHGLRGAHAKGHAIVRGTLRIATDLPDELAQGLFARGGAHDVVMRFSTNAGDILPDAIGLPRGLALKVMGVEGERLAGAPEASTQDFILVNGPEFPAATSADFLQSLKPVSKTTDKMEGAKRVFSAVAQTVERGLEAIGMDSARLHQMGGAPNVHPLGETFYTKTAYRYGDYIAKLALFPVTPAFTALTDTLVPTRGAPDALRTAMNDVLQHGGGVWELRVQLNTDLQAMPVENPTVHWDEALSPYRTVATLTVAAQTAWDAVASRNTEDALQFNIWHGLLAHQPLGSINRARRETYQHSVSRRAAANGCPVREPRSQAEVV